MKLIITLLLFFCSSISFSQWTRVDQLPATNIFTLFHKDSSFYAGGTNVIYVSHNKGEAWSTTTAIPGLSPVTSMINNIIVYKNELYASAPSKGIFKSTDDGITWQNITVGISPQITDLCEYRGDLYAVTNETFADPIRKLDPVNRNHWLSFSTGLTSISTVVTSIIGNNNALVAGTNNNGLYDYLPANSTIWEERFLSNPVSVNEGAFDMITAHDTLFLTGRTGKFYMSTNNGFTWTVFGDRLVTGNNMMVNAKQALISSRYIFNGIDNTLFYYIKKNSLQNPFQNFSVVNNHFSWKIDILGDKLWDASDQGLFYMSLSDLPGISAADDSIAAPVPVRFISFNANCETNKVQLTWRTAQEQNSSRFDIEKSTDAIHWAVRGTLPAAGNSNSEKTYSFTDDSPGDNHFYRIAEHDLDGRTDYTNTIRVSCNITERFSVWPNPVNNIEFVGIATTSESQAIIKLFDSKGALIKIQEAKLLPGSNQISMDLSSLPAAVYTLVAEWNNGTNKRTVQVVKQ